MTETRKWRVVYTHPKLGKKVADRLAASKIEAYFPVNKVWKQWSDRKKNILEPLFTSYVFVRITDSEFSSVKKIKGIVDFLYWIEKPAVIREEEIEAIKDFLSQCENVRLEKSKVEVTINEKVKITNNNFIYKQGNVIGVQLKSVNVYLPSLGYQLIAEIENSNNDIIKEFEIKYGLVS